jgi:hypothetical protein
MPGKNFDASSPPNGHRQVLLVVKRPFEASSALVNLLWNPAISVSGGSHILSNIIFFSMLCIEKSIIRNFLNVLYFFEKIFSMRRRQLGVIKSARKYSQTVHASPRKGKNFKTTLLWGGLPLRRLSDAMPLPCPRASCPSTRILTRRISNRIFPSSVTSTHSHSLGKAPAERWGLLHGVDRDRPITCPILPIELLLGYSCLR